MNRAPRVALATIALSAVMLPTSGALLSPVMLTGIRIDNPAPQEGAWFGFAVAGLGDVNGDGTSDLAVGAPIAGRVYIFSGSDQSIVHEIADPDDLTGTPCAPTETVPSPCNFGYSLAGVGDVDGDGADDLAIGAPGSFGVSLPCGIIDPNEPCPQMGRAFIFSGATGNLLVTLAQIVEVTLRGVTLAPLGLVDGDSVPDVAMVASGNIFGGGGLLAAFSGADGSVLWTQPPLPTSVAIPGLAVAPLAAVEDLTGDGVADLVAGADCAEINQVSCAGKVYVLSGATGAILRTHDNPSPLAQDGFGVAVANVGDQDADGVVDYAVAEPGGSTSAGSLIHLFSGASGAPIGPPLSSPVDERNAPGSARKGMALAGVDDTDEDGVADFWVGGASSAAAHLLNAQGDVLVSAADSVPESGFGVPAAAIGAVPGGGGLDVVVGAPKRQVGSTLEAGAVFLLRPEADVAVTKVALPPQAVPGDIVTYSVTVTNNGPFAAIGVQVVDGIPAGGSFVAGSLADDPACAFNALLNQVACTAGTVAAAATFSFDFELKVPDDAVVPSSVSNSVVATATSPDPDSSNNTATIVTNVTCDVIGTPGNDVLVGTEGGESICGLGGDDQLIGLGGDDVLVGGVGDDVMHGEQGDDVLRGGSGADSLHGQSGADVLSGGDGDDSLFGGADFDSLDGGNGFDTCRTQADGGASSACEAGGP
jgi:uncharacterized repeat protein (TIGR01451 family)